MAESIDASSNGFDWQVPTYAGLVALLLAAMAATWIVRSRWRALRALASQLQTRCEFHQAMLDAVPYPIFCKDAQGAYLAVNHSYEIQFGVQRMQLLGRSLLQTRHIDIDCDQVHRADLRVLRSHVAEQRELILPVAGGDRRCYHARLEPLELSDGHGALLGVLVDTIERREKAESTTTGANFLAMMSHEIRTPMNGMLGTLELLDHSGLSERQRTLLQTAGESSRSLLRIIDDILDLSKIETGKLSIVWLPFDLRLAIDATASMLLSQASSKGLQIDVRVERRVAKSLSGDDVRLRQVLASLIRQTIKFTPEGRVHVDGRVLDEAEEWQDIEISVSNTNVGIAAAHWTSRFDPIAQCTSSNGQDCDSEELWLAVAHRLCGLMDLSLRVESEPEGGSRAIVRGRFAVAERHSATEAIGQVNADRPWILVAEDHSLVRDVLRHQLAALGWPCDLVNDGEAALAALANKQYALLITDCYMPKMDGFELTQRIRAGETDSRLPIIALTASVMAEQVNNCLASGMDDVMAKPLRLGTLADTLHRWITGTSVQLPACPDDIARTGDATSDIAQVQASLARVYGDDVTAVLKNYTHLAEAELGKLNEALTVLDTDKLREVAHSLRGMAAFFGANQLAEVASSIESDTQASDVLVHARELESYLSGFTVALKQAH
ncbi:PAS domain-containing sensor histidine kinase [Dyella subtropica]|uniref:PAS domain-containing sensor histidine kinase n=1 Tax=Dyella subtropica TaxID=2992127 RepID=UPI0022565D35|nr:PAS domain-containing sensor histidine kinase [Dyella subtropica]